MHYTVSIVIVNYKSPELLRLCLHSLLRHIRRGFSHEIVVIDVASSPETQYVVTEEFQHIMPTLRIIPFNENIGYTRGVNEGIRASRGDHILMLNPDIVITPDSVEKLSSYLRDNTDIGLIGPQLLNFNNTSQDSCFKFYTPLTVLYRRMSALPFAKKVIDDFLMRNVDITGPLSVDWLMGSAFMTTRKAIRQTGILDEKLFMYMSDVDWARRFWENRYRVVYNPDISMYHYHKRGSKGRFGIFDILLKRETRWHVHDAIRYFAKHGILRAYPPARNVITQTL